MNIDLADIFHKPVTAKPTNVYGVFCEMLRGEHTSNDLVVDTNRADKVSALHEDEDGHTYRVTVEVVE